MISAEPLSEFAEFHENFKGKNFVRNGFIYPKYVIWWDFVKAGISVQNLPVLFKIVDKPGWRNGRIVNKDLVGIITQH